MTEPEQSAAAQRANDALQRAGVAAAGSDNPVTDEEPKALVEGVLRAVVDAAPPGWQSVRAAFSVAGDAQIANIVATTDDSAVEIPATTGSLDAVRTHRRMTIGPRGPWLRLLFECDSTGALQVAFDYGDVELPAEHLLPSEAYARDLDEFPRAEVPLWLLAYVGNSGRQLRTAAQARKNAVAAGQGHVSDNEIPSFPAFWARMAVLSAVCRGSDAPVGPRADPAFQLYIGDNGGCTLCRLPGGRAVLSGGRVDSALLTAAYRRDIAWPDLYRDAPVWVHNLYLDPRVERGLLSFCYWWDGEHWFRSDVPEAAPLMHGEPAWKPTDEIARGVPGIWTADGTAKLVSAVLRRIGVESTDLNAYAAIDFVRAAESRIASERYLKQLFPAGVPDTFDIAEALAQLDAADVLLPWHPRIDEDTAKDLVVQFCRANDFDTAAYPLDKLVADRRDMGWQVFVPVPEGEIAIGRVVFLVADDGVVEQASTSASPSEIATIFATRFADRVRRRR